MRPLTFDQAWIKDGRRLSGAYVPPRKPASCESNDDDAPTYVNFLQDTPQIKQCNNPQSYNRSLICHAENDGARRTPARTASKHLARHLTHKDALLSYADQRKSAINEIRRTHSNSSSSTSSSTAPCKIPLCSTAAKTRKQAATSNQTSAVAAKVGPHTRTSPRPVWSSSDDDSDLGNNATTASGAAVARRQRDLASAMYDTMTTTPPYSTTTFGRLRRQTPSEAAASSITSTSIGTASTISALVAAAAAHSAGSTSTSSIGTSVVSPSRCRSPPSVTLMHGCPDGGSGGNDDDVDPDACPCEACAARIAVRRSATYQALSAGPPASQLRSAIGPISSRSSGGAHRIRTPVVYPTTHTPRMSSSLSQRHKRQQEGERQQQQWEGSSAEAAERCPSAAALLSLSSGGSSRRTLQETRDGEDRRRHMSYDLPYHQRLQSPRDYREVLFGAAGGLKGFLKDAVVTKALQSRKQKTLTVRSRMVDFFLSEGGAVAAAAAAGRCWSRPAGATAARRRTAVDSEVGSDFDVAEATLRPDYVTQATPRHIRRGVWEQATVAAATGGLKGPTISYVNGSGRHGNHHVRQENDLASETVVLMSDSSEDELVRRVTSFARRGAGDGGGPALGPPRGRVARDQWAAEAATAAAAARVASRVRRTLAGTPGSLSRRMLQTDLLRPGASRSSSSVASTSKRSISSARSTCSNRSGGSAGSRRSGESLSHRGERQQLGDGAGGGAGRWLMTEALRSPGYGDGYDGPHDGSSDGAGGGGRLGATRSPSQRLPLSAVWGGGGGGGGSGGRRSSGRPPRSPPTATGDAASVAALKRWIERYGNRTAGAGSSCGGQRRVDGVGSSRRVLQF